MFIQKKKFTRYKENFTCVICGHEVIGNGYTNHCPNCLWSVHVDVNPGDRESECMGKMKPISIGRSSKGYYVMHRCERCGIVKKNKISDNDTIITLTNTISHFRLSEYGCK